MTASCSFRFTARKALEDTLDEEEDDEIDDSAALDLDNDDEGAYFRTWDLLPLFVS